MTAVARHWLDGMSAPKKYFSVWSATLCQAMEQLPMLAKLLRT